jgi:hypothetical protein
MAGGASFGGPWRQNAGGAIPRVPGWRLAADLNLLGKLTPALGEPGAREVEILRRGLRRQESIYYSIAVSFH